MNEIIRDTDDYRIENRMIYLDAAASSDPEAETYVDMMMSLQYDWYNPSSVYQPAKDVRNKVELARDKVCKFINAKEHDHIIFGSCASEMIGLALNGDYCVISSSIEHPSLYNRDIFDMNVKTDCFGMIDMHQLEEDLEYQGNKQKVVAFAGVNSEIGVIQNMQDIIKMAHEHNALVMVDWSQGAAHIPIDVQQLDIDMLVMTSEKCGCPRGTGILYVKKDIEIEPLWFGGNQEKGKRPGTENTAFIIAFGNQLERIQKFWNDRMMREWDIRDQMIEEIDAACEDICEWGIVPINKLKENGQTVSYSGVRFMIKMNERLDVVPNILSVMFKRIDNQHLLTLLDMHGVQCSASSACSSYKKEPSRVLKKIGLSDEEANNVLRFSFDYRLKDEEIKEFGRRLRKCLLAIKMLGE